MIGELNEDQIDRLLGEEIVGRIGCHADGVTYVVPVNYVHDAGRVYGQTVAGMKIEMMRRNPSVCFEVDRVEALLTWKSVIAWGTYRELAGPEAERALDLLVQRLLRVAAATRRTRAGLEAETIRSAYTRGRDAIVWCIDLAKRTGRHARD